MSLKLLTIPGAKVWPVLEDGIKRTTNIDVQALSLPGAGVPTNYPHCFPPHILIFSTGFEFAVQYIHFMRAQDHLDASKLSRDVGAAALLCAGAQCKPLPGTRCLPSSKHRRISGTPSCAARSQCDRGFVEMHRTCKPRLLPRACRSQEFHSNLESIIISQPGEFVQHRAEC